MCAEGLVLRDATADDAAVIAEIYSESIAVANATMDAEPKTAEDIRRQMAAFTHRELYVMLESGEQILGWGLIKLYSPRAGYSRCAETSVYLYQSQVRQGYGSFIKRDLIARCKAYGYHHLIARVWADNAASIEYNRRFGYEVVGIQREIGYIDGHWQDIAVLQLVLDDVGAEIADRFE
jgi:phosphinothricin acetyltransferase